MTATALDPNPAVARSLSHMMLARERMGADITISKETLIIYKRTLNFHEPLETRVRVKKGELENCVCRLHKLASDLGFEVNYQPNVLEELESLTLTCKKLS